LPGVLKYLYDRVAADAFILFGSGVLCGYSLSLFKWGPCGPSSVWGLIFPIASLTCFAVGALLVVAALLRKLLAIYRSAL
jgi:hypothetical protein